MENNINSYLIFGTPVHTPGIDSDSNYHGGNIGLNYLFPTPESYPVDSNFAKLSEDESDSPIDDIAKPVSKIIDKSPSMLTDVILMFLMVAIVLFMIHILFPTAFKSLMKTTS